MSQEPVGPVLEAVRRLEDRDAIRRLVHDYGLAVDDRDFTALTNLFTNDAVMLSPEGLVEGRNKVIETSKRRLSDYTMTFHVAHTHGIDLLGMEKASGIVTGSAQLAIDGRTFMVALRYHDEYRKDDERWRFVARRQAVFYVLPFDEMAHALAAEEPIRWPGVPPSASDIVRQD